MKIVTICGNGIGSSLMCKMKIEEIVEEEGLTGISVESSDFNGALSKGADLYVSVEEFTKQLPAEVNTAIITSYVSKKKIKKEVLEKIKNLYKEGK